MEAINICDMYRNALLLVGFPFLQVLGRLENPRNSKLAVGGSHERPMRACGIELLEEILEHGRACDVSNLCH